VIDPVLLQEKNHPVETAGACAERTCTVKFLYRYLGPHRRQGTNTRTSIYSNVGYIMDSQAHTNGSPWVFALVSWFDGKGSFVSLRYLPTRTRTEHDTYSYIST
jgi:hypothetical protein